MNKGTINKSNEYTCHHCGGEFRCGKKFQDHAYKCRGDQLETHLNSEYCQKFETVELAQTKKKNRKLLPASSTTGTAATNGPAPTGNEPEAAVTPTLGTVVTTTSPEGSSSVSSENDVLPAQRHLELSLRRGKSMKIARLVVEMNLGLIICEQCGYGLRKKSVCHHLTETHARKDLLNEVQKELAEIELEIPLVNSADDERLKPWFETKLNGHKPIDGLKIWKGRKCVCGKCFVSHDAMRKHLNEHKAKQELFGYSLCFIQTIFRFPGSLHYYPLINGNLLKYLVEIHQENTLLRRVCVILMKK